MAAVPSPSSRTKAGRRLRPLEAPGPSWKRLFGVHSGFLVLGAVGPLLLLEVVWLCSGFLLVAPFALMGGSKGVAAVSVYPLLMFWYEGFLTQWILFSLALWGLGLTFVLLQIILVRIFPVAPWPGGSLLTRASLYYMAPVLLTTINPQLSLLVALVCMVRFLMALHRDHAGSMLPPILSHGVALGAVIGITYLLPSELKVDLLPWLRQGGVRMDLKEVQTPRKRREILREIEILKNKPYVSPENTTYYVGRKDLPADLRFLIAKEKADTDPTSMRLLGDCYYQGIGVTRDPMLAWMWWEKAIQRSGDCDAKLALGLALVEDRGLSPDHKRALELISAAIRWRGAISKTTVQTLEAHGLAKVIPDWGQRFEVTTSIIKNTSHDLNFRKSILNEMRKASDQGPLFWPYQEVVRGLDERIGNIPSSFAQTNIQSHGQSIPVRQPTMDELDRRDKNRSDWEDEKQREIRIREAAYNGDRKAMEAWAWILKKGPIDPNVKPVRGAKRDEEIVWLLMKAQSAGLASKAALRHIVWSYESGVGNPRDYEKADQLRDEIDYWDNVTEERLFKNVKNDRVSAMGQYGKRHYFGHGGLKQDQTQGLQWMQKAVDKGWKNLYGFELISDAFGNGSYGYPKDQAKASQYKGLKMAFTAELEQRKAATKFE